MPRVGEQIGSFRIIAPLGAGGMGEVWRAEDTQLGRQVALKALPAEFSGDADRMGRFEREARVLASLNHPNIATLYGLEKLDGKHVLVMELVEGEGLDQRIARGPIPVDEAIPIALQIAEGLEAAHEAGIVHRDLKPANIKLRTDGTVKLLDFGLAKAWDPESSGVDLAHSPTLTQHATAAGVLLGTAAYMSPEQARGKRADRRADIWAFGVVIWEMLTGRRMFDGETVSDVLASVLKETPPVDALPGEVPARVRRLIRRCLERDHRRRLQWIGDARVDLEGHEDAPSTAVPAEATGAMRWRRLPWLVAAGAAAAAAILAVLLIRTASRSCRSSGSTWRRLPVASFTSPQTTPVRSRCRRMAGWSPSPLAAMTAWCASGSALSTRPSCGCSPAPRAPATRSGLRTPAGSATPTPASCGSSMRRGSPLALCDAPDGKGGTWSKAGVIVFAPSYNSPLYRVPRRAGCQRRSPSWTPSAATTRIAIHASCPTAVTSLYVARAPRGTQRRPRGGGRLARRGLDGPPVPVPGRRRVHLGPPHLPAGSHPDGATVRCGQAPVSGRARFPIADDVTLLAAGTVAGVYSASQSGVLAFQQGRGGGGTLRLVWKDRDGRELESVGAPSGFDDIELLPDGRQLAAGLTDSADSARDLWIFDLERDVADPVHLQPGPRDRHDTLGGWHHLVLQHRDRRDLALQRKRIGGSGGRRGSARGLERPLPERRVTGRPAAGVDLDSRRHRLRHRPPAPRRSRGAVLARGSDTLRSSSPGRSPRTGSGFPTSR